MKQRLSLTWPALGFTARAVLSDLGNVPAHGAPTFYLALVIRTPPPHEVAAIPLKPAAGIFVIDPAAFSPLPQWLRRVNPKAVELCIVTVRGQPRIPKPGGRKFLPTVSHVLSTEHTQLEHFLRGQFRMKIGMKVLPYRLGAEVDITSLHKVIDCYLAFSHLGLLTTVEFPLVSQNTITKAPA
jgi:hypothetical protein